MMKWINRQMLVVSVGVLMSAVPVGVLAAMTPLDADQLSSITGEGTGLQISLSMQINGTMSSGTTPTWTPSNDATSGAGCFTTATSGLPGANSKFCRFGFQENNVYNWLLLKGLNGFIDIPQLIVFGSSATVATSSSTTGLQSVIGFKINMPTAGNANGTQININNLAATFAMAVNTGCYSSTGGVLNATNINCTSSSYNGSTLQAYNNQNTYYDTSTFNGSTYASGTQYASPPDAGKETGIATFRISGNLNVGGTIYAFARQ